MKANQKGFTVVEILIVIVVLALIGAAVWLVYDRQKSDTDNNTATITSKKSENKDTSKVATSDSYEGWANCSDPIVGASVKYPANWQNNVTNPTNGDGNPCGGKYDYTAIKPRFETKSPKTDGILFRAWYMPGNQYNQETLSDLNKVIHTETITTSSGKSLRLIGYANQYNENKNALSGIVLTDQNLTIGQTFRGYPTVTAANGKLFALTATLGEDNGGSAESYELGIYKQQSSYENVLKMFKSVTF
ncbi:MAG: prepilin-type N-terminal cleavage/methylation domain-containing protein [Candidatus Saccharimonadales bacterium]